MLKGAKTSITTNRPIEESQDAKDNKEKATLEEKAKLSTLSQSEAGIKLMALISLQLSTRLDAFLSSDPQCLAYNNMLKQIGFVEVSGKIAVNNLVKKYFPEPTKEPAV